jgi:phosphatidylglycerophosphate synthase
VLKEIRTAYRQSLKPADSYFNIYLARPLAAMVVVWLAKTRITPNQVTLFSVTPMLAGLAAWVLVPGYWGLWLGVLGVQLAYILDCADGQLARFTGRTSVVGGELDFMVDELKAYALIGALTIRWHFLDHGKAEAIYVGTGTLVILGIALSLTKFVRTDEYAAATGIEKQGHGQSAAAAHTRRSPLWPIEMAARFISQYPVCLPIFALFDRMDLFVWAYGVVHILYAGKTGLTVALKLGGFTPSNGAQPNGEQE